MKTYRLFSMGVPAILIAVLLTSCSLFREPDISDSRITLFSPADSINTVILTQTFWWSPVEDAEGYNLKIVSPDFDAVERLVVDTNVSVNQFIYTLSPGVYQWAVYAYNHNSSTYESINTLIVDTSNLLDNQIINLLSPAINAATNNTLIRFEWAPLPLASYYTFEVRDSGFYGAHSYYMQSTSYDTINIQLQEGKYEWGVRAYNDYSSTNLYSTRYLIVDLTSPGKPSISFPVSNGDTLTNVPFEIRWNHPLASLSAISDSIWISQDSLFSTSDIFFVSAGYLSVSDFDDGKYYTRVKSIDAAGNKSEMSSIRKFYIYKD